MPCCLQSHAFVTLSNVNELELASFRFLERGEVLSPTNFPHLRCQVHVSSSQVASTPLCPLCPGYEAKASLLSYYGGWAFVGTTLKDSKNTYLLLSMNVIAIIDYQKEPNE